MKTLLAILILVLPAVAKKQSTNPTDYPLAAHIVSAGTTETPSQGIALYNQKAETWTYGASGGSWDTTMQVQIGHIVYTTGRGCLKEAQVGDDVRASKDGDKLLILTNGGKTCWARITNSAETK
jgi:hypothetical protein